MHRVEKARAQRELRRLLRGAHVVAPQIEASVLSWAERWIDGRAEQCASMTEQAIAHCGGEMDERRLQNLANAFRLAYRTDAGAVTIDDPDDEPTPRRAG